MDVAVFFLFRTSQILMFFCIEIKKVKKFFVLGD